MNWLFNCIACFILFLSWSVFPVWAESSGDPGILSLKSAGSPIKTVTEGLAPDHPVWSSAPANPIHFNRTPALYSTDAPGEGPPPEASVRLVRASDGKVLFRIQWTDATENLAGKGARYPDAGEGHTYKVQTEQENAFADAACLMFPEKKGSHARYPSLMMGEAGDPMLLYYWRAGMGFQLLNSHGRSTVADSTEKMAGKAVRLLEGWCAVFAVPALPERTPVSFALWDGSLEHRDGLKYFSLWYEVE